MRTLQRQRKHDDETDIDSNAENQSPTSNHPTKKSCRLLSKTNSANTSSDFKELKELIATAEKHRQENNKEMVETLKESTRAYERTSEKYLEVLVQLTRN